MRLIDADALVKNLKKHECESCEISVSCAECATDYAIRKVNEAPTVERPEETHNDLILRIVRAGLCARKPQHICVDPDGNVTVFGMTETARLVKEVDRERHWHCSKCGTVFGDSARTYRFCPECGAEFTVDLMKEGDYDVFQ